jgi:hypothetical protein
MRVHGAPMTARVWPISHVRSWRFFAASVLILAALLFSSQLALAQFTQQGPKLVGTGAIGNSWAGRATTRAPGRRGSTRAAAVSGPSKAASWSVPVRLDNPSKALPSRCPPTATPPSWAGLATTTLARRGSTPGATAYGPSRAASWSARELSDKRPKAARSRFQATATPPS